MTLRVTPAFSPSRIARLASLLALGLASVLVGGCHLNATSLCQKESGLSGEALEACIRAYEEAAPRARQTDCYSSDAANLEACGDSYVLAEATCLKEKQDCIDILNSFEFDSGVALDDNGCRTRIPKRPEAGSDEWFDAANGVVNRYNGCHTGVLGFYGQIVQNTFSEYCMIQVDKQGVFSCI